MELDREEYYILKARMLSIKIVKTSMGVEHEYDYNIIKDFCTKHQMDSIEVLDVIHKIGEK